MIGTRHGLEQSVSKLAPPIPSRQRRNSSLSSTRSSLLYGLTVAQVEHVFATFHRGWNYAARLERVLAYYEQ